MIKVNKIGLIFKHERIETWDEEGHKRAGDFMFKLKWEDGSGHAYRLDDDHIQIHMTYDYSIPLPQAVKVAMETIRKVAAEVGLKEAE